MIFFLSFITFFVFILAGCFIGAWYVLKIMVSKADTIYLLSHKGRKYKIT